MRKNQKVIKNHNNELAVKIYLKKEQSIIQQSKFKPPNCPSCKRNKWLDWDKLKVTIAEIVNEFLINKNII